MKYEVDIELERRAYAADEPAVAAARLLEFLEANGAIFRINAAGYLHTNLDPLPSMSHAAADKLSRAILALGPELKTLLRARTVH